MANKDVEKVTEAVADAGELASNELKLAMAETESGTRIFDAEGFGRLQIRFPTNKEERIAELEYSKAFTEYLDSNLKTRAEMERILEQRGLWSKNEDEALRTLYESLNELNERLVKAKSAKARKNIIETIRETRAEIARLNQIRQSFFDNTIEEKADFVRLGHLLSMVTTYADTGERVWKSFDDFNNESNQAGVAKITYEWYTFRNGVPSNFLDYLLADMETLDENGEQGGE